MNSNSNPFQDPAVVSIRTPSGGATLDPAQVNIGVHVHPPAPTPTMSSSYQQEQGPLGVPGGKPPKENLMDEIGNTIRTTSGTAIMRLMRTVNLLLATTTIVAGLLAWIFGRVTSFQKVIAGIYIIMFGCLLLVFELRTEKIDRIYRLNFGFMYGNKSRTIFLLFMAIWPLSMGNFWLTILDAALLFVNAFFNYFVISQHPAFMAVLQQQQQQQQATIPVSYQQQQHAGDTNV